MGRIGSDTTEMILQSLLGKGGKEARAIIEDLHKQLKLSVGYLYKLTDPVRLNGRAIRQDAGTRKVSLPQEALRWMVDISGRYDLPAEDVVELATLNEIIEPGQIKPATLVQWMRTDGVSRARFQSDVRPYTPWEAPAPNVVHHFDTTKLEELHYDRGKNLLTWNPRANRKNSRGERPDAIWLYSMVDDHSRAKFAALHRSENQYNHLDFLYRAWSEKARSVEFPFYGVPKHLYMDLGPVNKSLKVLNALHKLGVHLIPTKPSTSEEFGSRKHGKVENPFRTYGKWLKRMRPRLEAGGLTWEEAEESLYQSLLKINNRVHSTTAVAPFARWLTVGKPQHMPPEDLWALLKHERISRFVQKDLTISINRHRYRLPEKKPYIDWVDLEVEVYWLKDDYEKIYVVRGPFEVELRELADLVRPAFHYDRGEQEKTVVDEARARAGAADYSSIRLWATDKPAQSYLPRKGEKFDETRIAEKKRDDERPSFAAEKYLTKFEVIVRLRSHGLIGSSAASEAYMGWVESIMKGREKIAETELNEVVSRVLERDLAEGEE